MILPHPLRQALWWFRLSRAVGREDHVRVVELAEAALRRDPDDLPALHFAALHAEALGLPDLAQRHADHALALDPDAFDLHCQRVRLLDPVRDRVRLEETARWLIALSQTTEPERLQEQERALEGLLRVPVPSAWKDAARQDLAVAWADRGWYLDWAREFLGGTRS